MAQLGGERHQQGKTWHPQSLWLLSLSKSIPMSQHPGVACRESPMLLSPVLLSPGHLGFATTGLDLRAELWAQSCLCPCHTSDCPSFSCPEATTVGPSCNVMGIALSLTALAVAGLYCVQQHPAFFYLNRKNVILCLDLRHPPPLPQLLL